MKKLMLATTIALLCGAAASTAFAEDAGRRAGGEYSAQVAAKGPAREERQEARDDRREERDDRRESRDDRRESRDDNRDWRADNRGDNRQGVRDWTAGNSDGRAVPRDVTRPTGIERPAAQVRPATTVRSPSPWVAQTRDRDVDHDRYGDHDRDDDRRRDYDRNRDYDWRNDWRNDRHDWRDDGRRDTRSYTRYRDARWSGYQWYPQYRYRAPTRYVYPYGYRPYRWAVGYRMPYGYYNSGSYILDWRYYRLPMPPLGYQWVRVDRDVVLVHMMSGYVRDVLFGLFY